MMTRGFSPLISPSSSPPGDRKSTRLNSSHSSISYAVFCLKKKTALSRCNAARLERPQERRGRRMFRSLHANWFFFFYDTATTEIYTLSLHDALPILHRVPHL